jgi:hypothetical protein
MKVNFRAFINNHADQIRLRRLENMFGGFFNFLNIWGE